MIYSAILMKYFKRREVTNINMYNTRRLIMEKKTIY